DPQTVTLETSAALAAVHAAVSGELGAHGRAMVLAILAVAGALMAANLFGLVQLRRKDFGRRRALGASQSLIVALLLVQTMMLATLGVALGVAGSLLFLETTEQPVPGLDFTGAVAVAAVLTALLAAVLPAITAARREPLYELRVA
ncbi:MAG: lipoprotein ABC transporter permease, partial [Promicromonosporaceae bacterium]|nr:lipoprotein ABC transporter permease [Promicromonosporaceae bacterium]